VPSLYDRPMFYELLHGGRSFDLDHYAGVAAGKRSPVLDVGAGTGRVALELARRGVAVVALEREPRMVERLAQRLNREPESTRELVQIVAADVREYEPEAKHALALCAHNGLAHQRDADELSSFFAAVRRVLDAGGRFYFDVPVPNPKLLSGHDGYVPWFRDPVNGAPMRCAEHVEYDAGRRLLRFHIELTRLDADGAKEHLALELRQFFPDELRALVEAHGFEVESRLVLGDEIFLGCRKLETKRPTCR